MNTPAKDDWNEDMERNIELNTPANEWREEFEKQIGHDDFCKLVKYPDSSWDCDCYMKDSLNFIQNLLDQHSARLVERGNKNAVIKEYKDEGAMFVLKVEDGKTYEASMPIPKWHEFGKLEYRTPSTKP